MQHRATKNTQGSSGENSAGSCCVAVAACNSAGIGMEVVNSFLSIALSAASYPVLVGWPKFLS
jgi:hypothetical protein